MPDFLTPFGPFHMVLLHLPIGALAALWFLEIMLSNDGAKHKNPAIGLLLLFLVLSTGLTIALGLAYETLGQYGDEIDAHELWGFIFGGTVLLTYGCYWTHRLAHKQGTKLCYLFSLLSATIAMIVASHLGGELIHGKGFLTKPFQPERVRTVAPAQATQTPAIVTTTEPEADTPPAPEPVTAPAPTPTPEPTVADEMDSMEPMMNAMSASMMDSMAVAPPMPTSTKPDPHIALFEASQAIFKRHCYNCHGATKQKGDYRLDSKHSINQGGKSGLAAITPGNAEDSELMYRMQLPRDDDDVMPPEEKDPVSTEDIEIVRQWIEQGAYWPDDKELSNAPGDYIKVGDTNTDEWIKQTNTTGAKAEYNAWGDNSLRVDLGVVDPAQLDQALQQLTQVRDKVTWLDCSQLTLPADFFTHLATLTKLQRLHLDGTDITDAQLKQLAPLAELTYLNLYNTQISDAGLTALQSHPSLQQVFLSQTRVTQAGITKLKQAAPTLEIIHN